MSYLNRGAIKSFVGSQADQNTFNMPVVEMDAADINTNIPVGVFIWDRTNDVYKYNNGTSIVTITAA